MDYNKIRISFKDGSFIEYVGEEWADYSYDGKYFSIYATETCVKSMFNADCVFSVEIFK